MNYQNALLNALSSANRETYFEVFQTLLETGLSISTAERSAVEVARMHDSVDQQAKILESAARDAGWEREINWRHIVPQPKQRWAVFDPSRSSVESVQTSRARAIDEARERTTPSDLILVLHSDSGKVEKIFKPGLP